MRRDCPHPTASRRSRTVLGDRHPCHCPGERTMDMSVNNCACPQRSVRRLELLIVSVGHRRLPQVAGVRRGRRRWRRSTARWAARAATRDEPHQAAQTYPGRKPRTTIAAASSTPARGRAGELALLDATAARRYCRAVPDSPVRGSCRSPRPVWAPSTQGPAVTTDRKHGLTSGVGFGVWRDRTVRPQAALSGGRL